MSNLYRICRAEKGTRNLVQTMGRNLQRHSDSVSLDRDLSELVKRLVNNRALEELPARQYRHFYDYFAEMQNRSLVSEREFTRLVGWSVDRSILGS